MEKKGLLAVSFGTSYREALEENIIPAEKTLQDAFPDYEMRRGFSSRKIVKKLRSRDGLAVDTTEEALKRMAEDGFTELLVQPTFVIHGFEFDELMMLVGQVRDRFEKVRVGHPLLNTHEDYETLFRGLAENLPLDRKEEAFVFMGHGTEHFANACYPALESYMHDEGYTNVFLCTVEGYPDLDCLRRKLKKGGFTKVTLTPLMLVAGDHARNDMAGEEEDSWKSVLEGDGFEVECLLRGLGSYEFIREMFADHAKKSD